MAGDEKCTDPVGCRHATVPFLAQRDTTSPAPPDSLNVPMNTRSNATFGEEVMPLNKVWARSRVSQSECPSEAFSRTTVPFEVPTITELSKTAGDENPFAAALVQRVLPEMESSANDPCIVSTNTFPYPTPGVEAISRAAVSRSHRTPGSLGIGDGDVPLFARSPRNSTDGNGLSGVGTGAREANVTESNPAL